MFLVSNDFREAIHAFCNIARTNLLYHTLNPSEKTIERRLQAIWASAWNGTFSDVAKAKTFISSKLQDIHLNVYMHYSKDLDSADTLDKVKTLARTFFKQTERAAQAICKKSLLTHGDKVKENLRNVWEAAQKTTPYLSLELVKGSIGEALKKAVVPQNIKTAYLEDLDSAQTIDGLTNRLQSYLNDLEVKGAGITSTSLGSQGHPKIIDVQRGERILGFMKTLGNSLEMDYHLLYSFFLNDCLGQEELHIQVPKASMFDIEKEQYVDSSGKKYNISKYNEQIKHLLGSVASLNTDITKARVEEELEFQNTIQTSPTGFFELVEGLNLADFFREKYLSLDDAQKDHFWFTAGLMTYLDLILGNRDRLIKLLPDMDGQYSFLATDENPIEESNLGNFMISDDSTKFYAIDNGIGDGERHSFTNIQEKMDDEKAYTDFLEKILTQPHFETLASNYLIKSLEKSIATAFQDIDYDENSLQSVLSAISKEKHLSSLNQGMSQMQHLLTNIILPRWNHASADPVRNTLDENFVQIIQARLDLFARLKSPPIISEPDEDEEDELAELDTSSIYNMSSPGRSSSTRSDLLTPFSPVMSRSKTTALNNIASQLKELIVTIESQDTYRRILAKLTSLEEEFLLNSNIQLAVAKVKRDLTDSASTKQNLAIQIESLANSLSLTNCSPRPSRLPSWDEREKNDEESNFSKDSSFSLFPNG